MMTVTGMMRRAVFSELQRRGLERRFQIQKYISKPERKKLAEKLGLKDSQVNGPETAFIGNESGPNIGGIELNARGEWNRSRATVGPCR